MKAALILALAIAIPACASGQTPDQEVVIPPGTNLSLELQQSIDTRHAQVGDAVRLKLKEDVRSSTGLLIPKKANLAARVAFLRAGDDHSVTLSIEVVDARWGNTHAKLHGAILFYDPPTESNAEPMMQVNTRETTSIDAATMSVQQNRTTMLSGTTAGRHFMQTNIKLLPDGELHFPADELSLRARSTLGFVTFREGDPPPPVGAAEPPLSKADRLFEIGADQQRRLKRYAIATTYFQQAAELGSAKAQNALGWLYGEGKGVHKDNITAYMWFDLAAESYPEINNRNMHVLEQAMSADDVAEAKRRAAEWRKLHPATTP